MNFERQDIGLGLFVIGAVVIVLVGLVMAVGILRGETTEVHVSVDNVTTLRKGSAVYVEGYRVGEIVEIEPRFTPDLQFDLTLAVRGDFPLYEGTRAMITTPGVIGDAVVYLKVPERSAGRRLEDGAWISQVPAPGVSGIISRADTLARAVERVALRLDRLLSPEVAGELLDQLEVTLKEARAVMTSVQVRFTQMADSLEYGIAVGTETLTAVNDLLARNQDRFTSLLDSTRSLVGLVGKTVREMNTSVSDQGPRLERSLEDLGTVLEEARILLEDMNRHSMWDILFTVRHPDSTGGGG
ncbi:MAG: MlaD family protein [bacterium]